MRVSGGKFSSAFGRKMCSAFIREFPSGPLGQRPLEEGALPSPPPPPTPPLIHPRPHPRPPGLRLGEAARCWPTGEFWHMFENLRAFLKRQPLVPLGKPPEFNGTLTVPRQAQHIVRVGAGPGEGEGGHLQTGLWTPRPVGQNCPPGRSHADPQDNLIEIGRGDSGASVDGRRVPCTPAPSPDGTSLSPQAAPHGGCGFGRICRWCGGQRFGTPAPSPPADVPIPRPAPLGRGTTLYNIFFLSPHDHLKKRSP